MSEEHFSFTYKARFFKNGSLNKNTRHVWIVLHGYGQLASYFIKKFSCLENSQTCIIAPEGLSRFYLEGFSGRVGATWMTREDRLTDIENYINYLDDLYFQQIAPFISDKCKIALLGFSQGCATLARWALNNKVPFDYLILWAGVIPPDINFERGKEIIRKRPTYLVYGTEDPFLEDTKLENAHQLIEKLGIAPTIYTFEGGHEINDPTLKKLVASMN